ncbi:MAG: class I SAM-dependent methyltransferase [Candidatus Harrisonbacteria bacterium]|nr:class I SAM-dependent methyltransferase [Candidatus Harrisonbacteria bacterium]
MKLSGFRIGDFLELRGWKLLEISKEIPLIINFNCPADDGQLKTIATLVGNSGRQIRIGCCPNCGYIGYIDKLSKDWINRFYLETWDDAVNQDVQKKAQKLKEKLKTGYSGKEQLAISAIKTLNIDKSRYVCEIGCGFGKSLNQLRRLGFEKLVGIENSSHRAAIAAKAYGLKTIAAPFDEAAKNSELSKLAPFSLIYSHHVLEHVYNPAEMIRIASELQKEEDYLVTVIPNFIGEPSVGVLGFFPHLHSFTETALTGLLRRYGYKVINRSLTNDREICVVAQKTRKAIAATVLRGAYNLALEKLKRGLALDGNHISFPARFWWYAKKSDQGGWKKYFKNRFLDKIYWKLASFGRKYKGTRVLVVENLNGRYNSEQASPIEIQFNGEIKLFYK